MIKKGTFVLVNMGSDMDNYGPGTLYQAKQDFDPNELLKEYLRVRPEQAEKYKGNFGQFEAWLCDRVLDPISFTDLYLGAYGIFGIEVKEVV